MRLSTAPERDEANGLATVAAALDAGIRRFDTAHAYGLSDDDLGHNERLLARALAAHPAGSSAFVISKGGMTRPGGAWRPDGRATVLRAHAEASAASLGRPADLFLIHAPDPRVEWATTVRALAKLHADGLAKAIGLSNVNPRQLDEALDLAPISAVQLAWNVLDDSAVRSGVIGRCLEKALTVIAHSPLGGPKQVKKLLRSPQLAGLGGSPAVAALAALLDVDPNVVVIPGARGPAAAREVAAAESLRFDADTRTKLRAAFPALRATASTAPAPPTAEGEVVLVMGLQGSGKTTLVKEWVDRRYERLNRDTLGKGLADVAKAVDQRLSSGVRRVVLDNTYVSRASRAEVLAVAAKHGVAAHGVWIDVPLHEAQVNVIWRMLEAHGRLLSPEELKRGKDNTTLPPLAQLRMQRELEVPTKGEGFTTLEVRPFVRAPRAGSAGRFVAVEVVEKVPASKLPTLVFGWQVEPLSGATLCTHGGGPPVCWCRPPLPGLALAFAFAHGLEPSKCELYGCTETHEVMAQVIGARFVAV